MSDSRSVAERFWSKVSPEPNTGCWLWMCSFNKHGYGQFRWSGKMRKAHRISFWLTHGRLGDDVCILHRCDQPACVNPDHLYAGTHTQNMADKEARGRGNQPTRERNGNARLTEQQVAWFRANWRPRSVEFGTAAMARRLGVHRSTLDRILYGDTWRKPEAS